MLFVYCKLYPPPGCSTLEPSLLSSFTYNQDGIFDVFLIFNRAEAGSADVSFSSQWNPIKLTWIQLADGNYSRMHFPHITWMQPQASRSLEMHQLGAYRPQTIKVSLFFSGLWRVCVVSWLFLPSKCCKMNTKWKHVQHLTALILKIRIHCHRLWQFSNGFILRCVLYSLWQCKI